jgi:hypothetical protein
MKSVIKKEFLVVQVIQEAEASQKFFNKSMQILSQYQSQGLIPIKKCT